MTTDQSIASDPKSKMGRVLTLRAWKWSITNTVELPPMDVYRAVAWLGCIPNLLIAELLIRRYDFGEKLRAAFRAFGRKAS